MNATQKAVKQLFSLEEGGESMRLAAEEWVHSWQALISILLSARTRDEVTIEVGKKLFKKYSTVTSLALATSTEVATIIRPVNFYRNKTKAVLGCAKGLVSRFHGIPPLSVEELITLPGVGRKTANVFLSETGKPAIGVDTHVSYISRALGWTKEKRPEKIERDLKKLFPKRYWRKVNSVCVRFGKTYRSKRKKDEILKCIRRVSRDGFK